MKNESALYRPAHRIPYATSLRLKPLSRHQPLTLLLSVSFLCFLGCSSGNGSDALPLRELSPVTPNCASRCHSPSSSTSPDPLTTNGTGAAGKHSTHVAVRGFGCSECHFGYKDAASHMNGRLDTSDFAVTVVIFDTNTNPGGAWSNDSGPQTGSCSALVCHGPNTLTWYGAGGAITNCTIACHAQDSVVSPDPLRTNGTGSTGKHVSHVQIRDIACQTCHSNYTSQYTHSNGNLDTGNSSVFVVSFDATNPGGLWSNDTGTGTGRCSATTCHGSDVLNWYEPGGESGGSCTTTCHSPGSTTGSPDPLTTNGSGLTGRHVTHVTNRGFACTKCHLNYMHQATHINGQLDTGTAATTITFFDATNPSGQWVGDTGAGTGSCSSLACHGTSVLNWYGTNTWTLPDCAACHSAQLNARRAVQGPTGDFNRQSHHVISYSTRTTEIVTSADCRVCHAMSGHMNGVIRLNDKDNAGQAFVYTPGNASSLEPFCLSCHDADGALTEATPLRPFSSANTLGTAPNAAGTRIQESWDKQNGHHRKGVTCLGSGTAGTGCHGNFDASAGTGSINAHGSGNNGLLANKYTAPISVSGYSWDASRYKLCLDCHNYYPGLHTITELAGVAPGGNYAQTQGTYNYWPYAVDFMVTRFHEHTTPGNPDRRFNLHLSHLLMTTASSWNYRGTSGGGVLSCVTCHNVHGVNGSYYLWDEWGFSIASQSGTEYGVMTNPDFHANQYPQYCLTTCHGNSGTYRYPRSPFNEAKATANNTSGGAGLQNGDTVVISFSDSTNGPVINSSNIDSVLELNSGLHSWIGTGGGVTAVWSSTNGKTNNVLTVTLNIVSGNPTIAAGDSIEFDLTTIRDTTETPVRGRMTLLGSF